MGVMVHACHPSNGRKLKIGGAQHRLAWAKKQDAISKTLEQKGAGDIAQEVECLPSRREAPEFKLLKKTGKILDNY
jgi:hypothetical protein